MKKKNTLLLASLVSVVSLFSLASCQDKEKPKTNPVIDTAYSKHIKDIYSNQKKQDFKYTICKATTSGYEKAYVVTYQQKKGSYNGKVNIVKDSKGSYDTKVGGSFTIDEESCKEE